MVDIEAIQCDCVSVASYHRVDCLSKGGSHQGARKAHDGYGRGVAGALHHRIQAATAKERDKGMEHNARTKVRIGTGAYVISNTDAVAAAGAGTTPPSAAGEGYDPHAQAIHRPAMSLPAGLSVAAYAPKGGGCGAAGKRLTEAELVCSLLQIKGHLWSAKQVCDWGDRDLAAAYFLRPAEEVYRAIEKAMEQRGFASLRDELDTMAELARAKAADVLIRNRYAQVQSRLNEAIDALDAGCRTRRRVRHDGAAGRAPAESAGIRGERL